MSGKLDKSLDELLSSRRSGARRSFRRSAPSKAASGAAPAGGIKKNSRAAKSAAKNTQPGPSGNTESKIMVSGLVSYQSLLDNPKVINKNASLTSISQ